MTYLERILQAKKEEVSERRKRIPPVQLMELPGYDLPRRSLKAALISRSPAVIAEIKRASPSKGMIRVECDPGAIALSYVRAGAAAVSVLTDEPFFKGSIDYLLQAREGHAAPILRKDFIIDSYQLSEARAYGADAVLLVVAVLGGERLFELKEEAERLGLETLVEVHNEIELEALQMGTVELLGINNRDLSSFDTTLEVTLRLAGLVPAGTVIVSESGIRDSADLHLLEGHGVHAVLVGEAFMRAVDPGDALRAFLRGKEGAG
jgi:indole-3-glycerol phosphate synthase